MKIYSPAEDSFFFSELLENYLYKKSKKELNKIKYLDLGCGSCILAETVSKFVIKENITCADINPEAVKLAKSKKFKAIKSDLFSKINKKFDIITFNAPYLPEEKLENRESKLITTGGKKGDEISLKFIKQAKQRLAKNGKIFLLVSSHTPMERINKFKQKLVAERSLFFEKLYILEFSS